ncbi:tetratricopeptide repeat protein [Rhodospirillaceae bacterium SYSU D60014]|uniref:tetratricopeptide repeat protein n=1 Tax=Virgifigura deserti TaxID=2268457 RepID=UPI0013C52A56
MADIFREIDEDLRREGLIKIWRRYGPFIIGAVLAIILAAVGYIAWERYAQQQQLDRARAYAAAVGALGESDETALQGFRELANGDDGYAALSYLRAAELRLEAGETEQAIEIYRGVANDDAIGEPFRSLARILMAMHSLDTAPPEEIAGWLEPLTGPADPWRHSAREMLGLLALRTGDSDRAVEIYTTLADDLEAPAALRARAAEILASLQAPGQD